MKVEVNYREAEKEILSTVIETVKGYRDPGAWSDVEDLFNLYIVEDEKRRREVFAFSLCIKLVPQLTTDEFEAAKTKLLEIAGRTPKHKEGKEVNVSFNERTFTAEIVDVEWLPSLGWVYDIRPNIGWWEERILEHIPEGNISDIVE